MLLKLVLQGLAADWNIDAELMNRALSASSRTLNHDGVELSDLSDAMRLLQSEARVACDDYQTTESVTKGIFLPSPTPPPSPSPSPIPVSHWLPTDSVSGIGPSPPTPNSASTSLSDQIGNVCLGHPGSWPSHKPRRIGIRHVARLATGLLPLVTLYRQLHGVCRHLGFGGKEFVKVLTFVALSTITWWI